MCMVVKVKCHQKMAPARPVRLMWWADTPEADVSVTVVGILNKQQTNNITVVI